MVTGSTHTGPIFQSRMGWFSPPFIHISRAFSKVDSHYKLKLTSRKLEQADDSLAHQGKRRQKWTLTLRIVLCSRFYFLESAIKFLILQSKLQLNESLSSAYRMKESGEESATVADSTASGRAESGRNIVPASNVKLRKELLSLLRRSPR